MKTPKDSKRRKLRNILNDFTDILYDSALSDCEVTDRENALLSLLDSTCCQLEEESCANSQSNFSSFRSNLESFGSWSRETESKGTTNMPIVPPAASVLPRELSEVKKQNQDILASLQHLKQKFKEVADSESRNAVN